jgi:rhomboid family protein
MRGSSFDSRRSVTVMILLVNGAVFLLQKILEHYPTFPTDYYFALSLDGLKHGFIWQLLTYQFMHANIWHLVFNCWAIYVFGREIEESAGPSTLLSLYFSSGVVGGLFQALAALFLGGRFALAVVGASAAAFGLVAAYAILFPDRVLLLFFIIPLRAKYLLPLCAALALFGIFFANDNVAHMAHLGGMLNGVFFVKYAMHHDWNWRENWAWRWHWPQLRRTRPQRPQRLVRVPAEKPGLWRRAKTNDIEEMSADEFLSKEVDPILDKISAHGIQSLTERERKILEAARSKMGKR